MNDSKWFYRLITTAGMILLCGLLATETWAAVLVVTRQPPTQAVAPAELLAATVADIPKGQKATAPPETLVVDESSKVWLNKTLPVGTDTGITVIHQEDDSYTVEISDPKLRWIKVPLTDDLKKILLPVKILVLPKK